MRIRSPLKILIVLGVLTSFPGFAAEGTRVVAYFESIEKDELGTYSRLIVNPLSSGAITLKVRKGILGKEFIRTVLDVELKILSPCVLICEAEFVRIVDVIAPHALPEAFSALREE